MKFYKLVKYDIKNGIERKMHMYFITFILCIIFVATFYFNISHRVDISGEADFFTITNIFFFLFQGKEPFSPELGNAFVFPAIWLFVFLFSAYITLDYPFRNLTEHGIYVMTRIRNRTYWWFSKCIFVFCSTLLYFLIWYSTTWLFCRIFGINISFQFAEYINADILNIELPSITKKQIIMLLMVLPVMTSLAVNFIQLLLGLFIERIYCFLITTIILFASTYFQTPILIGNFAMVKRSILCVEDGMTIVCGVLVNISLVVLCIIIGIRRIKKYDILKKTHKHWRKQK